MDYSSHFVECLTRLGGMQAVAWALAEGCSFHVLKNVGLDYYAGGRLAIRYRGCYYIDYGEGKNLREIVVQLKALWLPWLRRLSPWTRYLNYTPQGGED